MAYSEKRKAQLRAWYTRNKDRLKLQRDLDISAEEAEKLLKQRDTKTAAVS